MYSVLNGVDLKTVESINEPYGMIIGINELNNGG